MSRHITDVLPFRIIVSGEDEFRRGVLFPHNILFHNEAISLPFALSIMNRIANNQSLLDKIQIESFMDKDKNDAILSFDCKHIYNALDCSAELTAGKVYVGNIVAKSLNSTIIGVNGCYGYIAKAVAADVGDMIAVSVVSEINNEFCMCRFAEALTREDTANIDTAESQTIDVFLLKEELNVLTESQRTLVEWLLDNVGGLTRSNINVLREQLHISYNPTVQSNLHRFLAENPTYFSDNNFWVGCYRDVENIVLVIYDSKDVVLRAFINKTGIWVNEFSHDKNISNAQYLLDRNQNALIMSGGNIHFYDSGYVREDYIESGERIFAQYEVAKLLLPELKRAIKNLKEKAGTEYLMLKEYLSYQTQKEMDYNQLHSVAIKPNEAEITTVGTDGYSTGLRIRSNGEVEALFTESDEDVCYVELSNRNEVIKAKLTKEPFGEDYFIEFHTAHMSVAEWRQSGFEIRRRAGTKHLLLQQNAIDDFVYGNNRFDIFDKLNKGELIAPSPDADIVFFDEKFNNVEEGNNQPMAIRKAVNNNDIFLIQGPPGTGKTSVIVEIVKQLAINKNERVLVCSQAHSAVKNIYDRLKDENRLKIGYLNEKETMIPEALEYHNKFLSNNTLLLDELSAGIQSAEQIKANNRPRFAADYPTDVQNKFIEQHNYVCDYFEQNDAKENSASLKGLVSELRDGLENLGAEAVSFNNARHYHGLNVVMGTCIGIGLDRNLKRSGIRFDTVIIDEAGKANLSETTVPMQLGKKFILVGDQKQLPPYMDTEDIAEFIDSTKEERQNELQQREVEAAVSSSLFEDFLEDVNFPKESTILLNHQYRMNPAIGDYVSELFYDNELRNGSGTEKQCCKLEGFPNAVTFIDTSSNKYVDGRNESHECGSKETGWWNPFEIKKFNERILPKLEQLKASNPEVTIGIITPYRRQREQFIKALRGTALDGCVYTIDSIQGSEFDIVVLSLVRAFNPKRGVRKVGFLDDMRRLNVALSRAKKRLIILGNLYTLCDENAHFATESNIGVNPLDVFRKLKTIHERTVRPTSLDILRQKVDSGEIAKWQLFKSCRWRFENGDSRPVVAFEFDGVEYWFPFKHDSIFNEYGRNEERIDIQFIGFGEDSRAKFRFIPNVVIAKKVELGLIQNVKAMPVKWVDDSCRKMLFRFEDGSELMLPINEAIQPNMLFYKILCSDKINLIPINVFKGHAFLDKNKYKTFAANHKHGDKVQIQVVDYVGSTDGKRPYYIVKCGDVYGQVIRFSGIYLRIGEIVEASVFQSDEHSVKFNISTSHE